MNKWKYTYSFIAGILFILSFILKEVVINSPKSNIFLFYLSFILMIIYVIGLFLGFIKYSILNEKILLKLSAVSCMVTYPLIILIELLDRTIAISGFSMFFILIPKILLSIALLLFSVALLKQKKIYGKGTIFQGVYALLLSFSTIVAYIYILQLPMFFILFISLTYLMKKRIPKESNLNG